MRKVWVAAALGASCTAFGALDRQALVARHALADCPPAERLALGNGEFCFTADGTGLQSLGGNAMAHWAWHSFPLPPGVTADQVPSTGTFQRGRNTGPDNFPPGTGPLRTWMFDNPHILNLGRLRLCRANGQPLALRDLTGVARRLDLWTGVQTTSYQVDGQPVRVLTAVHPTLDAVAVRIDSPLVARGDLLVTLDFGYPSLRNDPNVGEFDRVEGHTTTLTRRGEQRADFARGLDSTAYRAALAWSPGATLAPTVTALAATPLAIKRAEYGADGHWLDVTAKVAARAVRDSLSLTPDFTWLGDPWPGHAKRLKLTYSLAGAEQTVEIPDHQHFAVGGGGGSPHRFRLAGQGAERLELVLAFAPQALPESLPTVEQTLAASAARWQRFWTTGGAIDLSGSRDPRWRELERRIVLSQYQLAAQSAGSFPSSESGLLAIDPWRGQFHMEMVWWHLAHYALWDRWELADQALRCYQRFAPAAQALAQQLGYRGLKWQKSVGPEGRTAPWAGNQVLLWKQPHPLFFAELEYRLQPTRATLDKWAEIVDGTAEHMADYPTLDPATGLYSLTPAMPPSEQGITRDTVFDLAYWRWGLDQANVWRQRRGLPRVAHWDEVRAKLAPLPVVDGVFVHSAQWHDTYTKRAWEHPDPVGVLGMLPPIEGVDAATAERTVRLVWEKWDWRKCWGWDFPWMAMAAARTGHPELAVEALLKEAGSRNHYDVRGLNTGGPGAYLPGNGGLLYAVALMAAGWDGAPERPSPGFPAGDAWVVRCEGLKRAP